MEINSTTIEIIDEASHSLNPSWNVKDFNKNENVNLNNIITEFIPETKELTKTELRRINSMDYAGNKNLAEGLMDIALLSANANQLRFLLTYNDKARTYYMSLSLVGVSLVLQVVVGLALIFKRHFKRTDRCYIYTKEFLICGVFVITVVNVLLAAFTTTESVEKV